MSADDRIELEAIRWRLRVPDMGDADWMQFTTWLEADPRHARAYDAVTLIEGGIGPILARRPNDATVAAIKPVPVAAPAPMPAPAARWRARGWMAMAAGMIAVIGATLGTYLRPAAVADRIVATRPGEQRKIALADGTQVLLSGGTRLTITGASGRRVRLDRGEAAFRVVHDSRRPFEVAVGPTVLRDVGTFFDVTRRTDGIEVAVAEGAVAYDPDSANVMLQAGQAGRLGGSPAVFRIAEIDRSTVAAWRAGKLIYRDAPLPVVAADLGRSIGWPIGVDGDLAARRFTGTIRIVKDRARMRARLAGLLDVAVSDTGDGWRLSTERHGSP